MASRSVAPFRADQVGSLLRPAPLRQARARLAAGEISQAALARVEDEAIIAAVAKQRDLGLTAVTDGEFRRAMWHFDFLEGLDGVEAFTTDHGIAFQSGIETKPKGLRVTGKIGFSGHPMVDHFTFVRDHAGGGVAKMTIPSPSVLHYRGGRPAVSAEAYPDMSGFFEDLGRAYHGAVEAFAAAGCRYLQLDETNLAYLCDPEQRAMLQARGDDPDALPEIYAGMVNVALADRPDEMAVCMHLCRGNFRSSWIAAGGYEPVAEILFNGIDVDGYFMEYDTERAGGFEPLRLLPKGKQAVLGLVTSKSGELESADALMRRIEEAATYCDVDQLSLSPQCGFSSTEEGNDVDESAQWRKLALVVEVAEKVWGQP
jgi:5-methyltetrahydropteroyltriglutamate--homocysteine methyltransferase